MNILKTKSVEPGEQPKLHASFDFNSLIDQRMGEGHVIHRSIFGIMRNTAVQYQKQREIEMAKNSERGWGAPEGKPYAPLGEFNNVLDGFLKCKTSIPHTRETRVDTQKTINYMKTIKHPILKGRPPERCIRIIQKNQHMLDSIKNMDKMRLMNKFSFIIEDSKDLDDENMEQNAKYVDNKKIKTPYFQVISHIRDGSHELRDEIEHSVERMKRARHGHSIDKVYKDHDYAFYLPKKTSYMSKKQAKLRRLDSASSTYSESRIHTSQIFKTEVPDIVNKNFNINVKNIDNFSSNKNSKNIKSQTSLYNSRHRKSQSFSVDQN